VARTSEPVKWMLIRRAFVFFFSKNSWLNAQLAEAVKFSSHKSQSILQDRHRT